MRPIHLGSTASGLALMRTLAREALAMGCKRFVWQVLDWNEPAIQFYESLGAKVLREWLTVRMDGDIYWRLAPLAGEGDAPRAMG